MSALASPVLVVWVDAHTMGHGWRDVASIKKQPQLLIRSVGWLIEDETDFVTLAASIDAENPAETNQIDGDIRIPRGCIVNVIVLHGVQ